VSASLLASHGIAFDEPKAPPPMAEAEAAAIASKSGGAVVLESHYAHCRMVSKNPPIDQDCWAFSLDPSRQRFTFGSTAPTYFVILVDPLSGEVLLREIGAPPQDPARLLRDPRLGPA
jgi:hypothetical protein